MADPRYFRAADEPSGTKGLRECAGRMRMPNLKPSTATISLRLPEGMLDELKILANQTDVPYQSLLKVFLAERLILERERQRNAR